MDFRDKGVFITGAGSGIGRATALAFAQEGAKVYLADLNEIGGYETLHQIEQMGGVAHFGKCDVTQAEQVNHAVQDAAQRWGGLQIAINNAGISGTFDKPIHESDDAMYERVMDVNVRGVWLCLKAEIKQMLSHSQGGAIVNVASVAGLVGAPRGAAYCASKHAVVGLTRAVALEYARKNIRVNAVCPSFVDTPMVNNITAASAFMAQSTQQASPMKRLGTPQEVAGAILYLCGSGASFINGTALAVDGGLTAL